MSKTGPTPHNNLFALFGESKEVYAVLQRDLDQDVRRSNYALAAVMFCLIVAALEGAHDGWAWLMAGLGAAIYYLDKRNDASNRNFLMHLLDWQKATGSEARE